MDQVDGECRLYDPLKSARNELRRLTKIIRKGKAANTDPNGYIRIHFKNDVMWSAIEEAILVEIMKSEHESSRSATIRRCLHERGMRVLGEKYTEITQDPSSYFDKLKH